MIMALREGLTNRSFLSPSLYWLTLGGVFTRSEPPWQELSLQLLDKTNPDLARLARYKIELTMVYILTVRCRDMIHGTAGDWCEVTNASTLLLEVSLLYPSSLEMLGQSQAWMLLSPMRGQMKAFYDETAY